MTTNKPITNTNSNDHWVNWVLQLSFHKEQTYHTLSKAFATALSTFSKSYESVWQTPADQAAQQWWAQTQLLPSRTSMNSCTCAVPKVVISGGRFESESEYGFRRLLRKNVFSLTPFLVSSAGLSSIGLFFSISLFNLSNFFKVAWDTEYWVSWPSISAISEPQLHRAHSSPFLAIKGKKKRRYSLS